MMSDRLPLPYFGCRVFTDALCALLAYLLGGLIGLGTLICAFGLGPFVQFFTKHFSEKVLRYSPAKSKRQRKRSRGIEDADAYNRKAFPCGGRLFIFTS